MAASSASSAQDARKKKLGAGSLSTAPSPEPGPCHAKCINSLTAPEARGYTPGAAHALFSAWAGGDIVRAQSFGWMTANMISVLSFESYRADFAA